MIRPTFSQPKLGLGYHKGEVDAFVERLLATVNGGPGGTPVTRAELADLALRPALFGDRYSIDEVDRFVEGAAAWLPEHSPVGPRIAPGERPAFTTSRFREGYDPEDVDAFLERLFAAVEGRGPALAPEELRSIAFTPVRLRPGYAVEEVDAFLEQAAAWLPAHNHPQPDPDPGHPPRPSFTVGRFREGYDVEEVDAFVDKVYAALDGRVALTPADIQAIAFTPVRLREGYDVAEVDAFLDVAQTWLTRPA